MSNHIIDDAERAALEATLGSMSTSIRRGGLTLSEALSRKYPEVPTQVLASIIVDAANIGGIYRTQAEHLQVLFAAAFDLAER